jgi:hypothetical protein
VGFGILRWGQFVTDSSLGADAVKGGVGDASLDRIVTGFLRREAYGLRRGFIFEKSYSVFMASP